MDYETIHVLVVEDENDHAELIRRSLALNEINRFYVSIVENLEGAAKYLSSPPDGRIPDIVLADLILPDGRGIDLLPGPDKQTDYPVVLMTSHGNEKIAVEAIKAGALDYLVKSRETLANIQHWVMRALREWEHIVHRKNAEKKVKTSLIEKTALLQEISHRVKNNLQMILSLLNLQSNHIDDKPTLDIITKIENRIYSIALAQEHLYQEKNLSEIDFARYLEEMVLHLQAIYDIDQRINLDFDIREHEMCIDMAVPIGLIVNELIVNSFRFAFPEERSGIISVVLKKYDNNMYKLVVTDNGVGFDNGKESQSFDTLGLLLVEVLVGQLKGEMKRTNKIGTRFEFHFECRKNPPQVDA